MKEGKPRSWIGVMGYRPKSLDLLQGKFSPADLGRDVTAGITVGMIALPLALSLGIASIPSGWPAVGCFLVILFWPRLGFRKIPGSIVAMLSATALAAMFDWQHNLGISTIALPHPQPHGFCGLKGKVSPFSASSHSVLSVVLFTSVVSNARTNHSPRCSDSSAFDCAAPPQPRILLLHG